MKGRFHINPRTLQPSACGAEDESTCPFSVNGHYSSQIEAMDVSERLIEEKQARIEAIKNGPDSVPEIPVPEPDYSLADKAEAQRRYEAKVLGISAKKGLFSKFTDKVDDFTKKLG